MKIKTILNGPNSNKTLKKGGNIEGGGKFIIFEYSLRRKKITRDYGGRLTATSGRQKGKQLSAIKEGQETFSSEFRCNIASDRTRSRLGAA